MNGHMTTFTNSSLPPLQSRKSNILSVTLRPHCSQIAPDVLAALIDSQPDYLLLASSLAEEEIHYILSQVRGQSPQTCCIRVSSFNVDMSEICPNLSQFLKEGEFLLRGIVCHQL
jgi:hypothetical protein